MNKIGFFQIVYTKYKTKTNKDRIKKEFLFLEEIETKTTLEELEKIKEVFNRYKTYNNIIMIDYDNINNGYIFSKSRLVSLRLHTIKGTLQEGEKVDIIKEW